MSRKSPEQKRARALQQDTGWSYSECLRCVRSMTEDQIDALVEQRRTSPEVAKSVGEEQTSDLHPRQ